MMKYALAFWFAALGAQSVSALEVGDTICVDGFVMDFYCIDRGTLFDNPTLETLRYPANHSVHCLLDVPSCINSPFEVLLDPQAGSSLYSRGFRLTDTGKATVIDLVKQVGSCDACDSSNANPLQRGFRAVSKATIVDLNKNSNDVPALIDVVDVQASHDVTDACQTVFQMDNVQDVIAAEIAQGNTDASIILAPSTGSGRTKLQKVYLAHGSLMLIGWGWLLPSGALIAKFFKHRPNGLWFKIHRACQTFGLLCALAGWICILKNVNVFQDKGELKYRHGVMGMTVMIGGLLQPINALARPHPPEEGEAKSSARQAWEILHKGLGYGTLLLAVATIGVGTTLLPKVDDQKSFQMAYGIGAGSLLIMLVVFMLFDKKSCPEHTKTTESEKSMDVEEQPAE